jgi:protein TIF31
MVARICKRILRRHLADAPKSMMAQCISHFLNCVFSKEPFEDSPQGSINPKPLFFNLTSANLHVEIQSEIKKRFRYDISLENLVVYPIALLRSICLKVGIQLKASKYSFSKSCIFKPFDILNHYPIVKHASPKVLLELLI